MLLQLVQYPLNGLYMLFVFTFGVDKDVIEVHYHENVELLCQDLIDVTLKHGRRISQSKRHNLVFEVTIVDPEDCLPFIAFSDPHLMVSIGQIELGETLSPT